MDTIRKFIRYYRPYQGVFYLDLVCAAVISVIDLIYPQILRTLTRTLFREEAAKVLQALLPIALGMLVMYGVQALCKYYVSYQGHMMGAHMERDMRQQLFDHYEKLSFSYYDNNNSGQMMSKLVSDLFDIAEFAHHGPENLFISLIKIIGSFICLFMINARLAVPLMILVVVMILFSARQNARMQETFMDNRRKIGDVNASLQDTLAGIRVVQSFANEEVERKKFRKSNESFLQSKDNNYHCMGSFMGGNLFFQGMMYLVTVVYGGWLIARGQMAADDLAMYALYIGIFISPIQILVELAEMMQKGLSGFKRFLAVMETEPQIVDAPGAEELKDVKGQVVYEDVSFRYNDEEEVLNHVSFTIPAGRSVALVGPSGGGKTTICSLLPRFYDVTSGQILIDGQDVRKVTLKSLRQAIGVVQQDVYLFSGTVAENIAYGKPGATQDEIVAAAKLAGADGFIRELKDGYDTYVGERGVKLSGGQKQRISIARVFLKNPPILLLDEATSALDNESEILVGQSLDALAKGRTTLTIAHRLTTIKNADRILVLGRDGIEEEGTHEELLARKGIYYRLWNGLLSGQTL